MKLGKLIKVGEIRACGDFSEMLEDRGLAVVEDDEGDCGWGNLKVWHVLKERNNA